jgi:flagellar protein FlgJ
VDITGLGAYYLDKSRYSNTLLENRVGPEAGPGTESPFSHILKRAAGDLAQNRKDGLPPGLPGETPSAGISAPEPPASPALSNRRPVIDKAGKLYEQCAALETFLVKTLITGMRSTIQKSEFLDGGFAGKMYEDMLYDEYAKDFAKNAGFGLAELAYLELTGQRGKIL